MSNAAAHNPSPHAYTPARTALTVTLAGPIAPPFSPLAQCMLDLVQHGATAFIPSDPLLLPYALCPGHSPETSHGP